ncbi:MAG: hypothetical protein E6265_03145 [Enterobacteriaceae bacterium]|nr:hypothetical protein [Enterobacteriaceae bacterium]
MRWFTRDIVIASMLLFCITNLLASQKEPIIIDTRNNIQGMVINLDGGVYTLEHQSNNPIPLVYLNQDGERNIILTDSSIGHQGIGVYEDRTRGMNLIFTSKKNSPFSGLAFLIKNDDLVMKREIFFFDDSFFKKNEVIPTISSDGKFLIVRGRFASRNMIIRVFDLEYIVDKIINSNKDIIFVTSGYKYQWSLPDNIFTYKSGELRPLQAIASNGKIVSIVLGNARVNPKAIYNFTMDGNLLGSNTNVTVGMDRVKSYGEEGFFEPEGLSIDDNGILSILMLIGRKNSISNYIYKYSEAD